MSFAGNLEDLAIVDVIQLLHSTRKSGTLCVNGDKGRSQIVFNNGFIVCANHYNSSVRIGKILVEMEAISEEVLQQTLAVQSGTVGERKPLIGLLIEQNAIEKDLAYKGLECLIEMTIVEMVSWQKGTFTLDVDEIDINDEYRYIPEKLQQEMNFDTQMVLLDALRIYDEKRAAGVSIDDMAQGFENQDSPPAENRTATTETQETMDLLSADILGLDSMDQLETQIQETFTGLETFDPSEIHRQKIRELLPDFPAVQREELVSYLTEMSNIVENQENVGQNHNQTIIIYGTDELVLHGVMSACKHAGIMVFSSTTQQDLEHKISQSLSRSLTPVLVFDCPLATQEGFTKDEITGIRQQILSRFPQLLTVQIASPADYLYSLQALFQGVNTVIPRSIAENRRDTFIQDFIQFLESFPIFIRRLCQQQEPKQAPCSKLIDELRQMHSASEISFFLLEQASQLFDRSMILILRKDQLFADRSFGIESDKSAGPSGPLRFSIPVTSEGLLEKIIQQETFFFDAVDDKTIRESIFGEISAPDKSKILLLPITAAERVVAIIYADFGQSSVRSIDTEYLQNMAWLASLALDKVVRTRKK